MSRRFHCDSGDCQDAKINNAGYSLSRQWGKLTSLATSSSRPSSSGHWPLLGRLHQRRRRRRQFRRLRQSRQRRHRRWSCRRTLLLLRRRLHRLGRVAVFSWAWNIILSFNRWFLLPRLRGSHVSLRVITPTSVWVAKLNTVISIIRGCLWIPYREVTERQVLLTNKGLRPMKSWHVPALIQYLTQQHEKLWRGGAVLAARVRILIVSHS